MKTALWVAILLLSPACLQAQATDDLLDRLSETRDLKELFRPFARRLDGAVVRLRIARDREILGTVVDARGSILTKASSLGDGAPVCVVADEDERETVILGIDQEADLALLRVEPRGLRPVRFDTEDASVPAVGQWLISVGPDGAVLGVGVLSVAARPIHGASGFLGVVLEPAEGGVRIVQVEPDSAAEKAGLLVDDVVLGLDAEPVTDRDDLIERIKSQAPGAAVAVTVRRGETRLDVQVVLGRRPASEREAARPRRPARRRLFDGRTGLDLSERRTGFALAAQHDTVLDAGQCGGPVLDSHGRVIGLNIARAGRTQTLALPARLLAERLDLLRSGRFAPERADVDGPSGQDADR